MSTLHITRGLPGAGKTTWARAWVAEDPRNRVRVNRDDLRQMVFGQKSGLQHTQESHITSMSHSMAASQLRRGLDVVADDTNLRGTYVKNWRSVAERAGASFEIHDFAVDVDEAIRRDAARGGGVGPHVIEAMARRFTVGGVPTPLEVAALAPAVQVEPYVRPWGKPRAIIVDLDGTLALHRGRAPFDMTRVGEDELNVDVADVVCALAGQGGPFVAVYCSGRSESARQDTNTWLAVNGLPSGLLFMRPDGDNRKDAVVKAELFDLYIRHEYDVVGVFDDRKQVVDMWRSMGLTVFQVAEGNF